MASPDWAPGDVFKMCGPNQCWWPELEGGRGWQPRAWTGPPGDPSSRPWRRSELYIDFARHHVVCEVRVSRSFVSVRISVRGQDAWINVRKRNVDWAIRTCDV